MGRIGAELEGYPAFDTIAAGSDMEVGRVCPGKLFSRTESAGAGNLGQGYVGLGYQPPGAVQPGIYVVTYRCHTGVAAKQTLQLFL